MMDFSTFSTFVLIITLFRLSLNIATTRMILSEGHNGPDAVSEIISSFGQFVVGGNYVIGVIVFTILVLINFMALVPGTWVRTSAGFYGTVVEVDGDVVTLATPLGEESLWGKRFIVGAEEPPFASTHEEEPDQEVEDVEAVEDVEDEAEDVKDVGAEDADEPVEAADDEQSGA